MRTREYYYLAAAFIALALHACSEEEPAPQESPDEKPTDTQTVVQSVQTDNELVEELDYLKDCYLRSIDGEAKLDGGQADVEIPANDCVQTFVVSDEAGNVYLIARSQNTGARAGSGQEVTINVHSTALSMVTMHPLFAPMKGDDYVAITSMITASPYWQAFYDEVDKAVRGQRNLFDESNESLMATFGGLIDDLCKSENQVFESADSVYQWTPYIASAQGTRAVHENNSIYPFYTEISGNTLTIRNTGLTPTYYGTVRLPGGTETELIVPSRSDYGGMDIFKPIDEINLGDPVTFTFSDEGAYHFYLSRITPRAITDCYVRIVNTLTGVMGLSLPQSYILALTESVSEAITLKGLSVVEPATDPMFWIGTAYEAIINALKSGEINGFVVKESFVTMGKILVSAFNWYGKIKTAGNVVLRIAYALKAPGEVSFNLCYYDNEVGTCADVTLRALGDYAGGEDNPYPAGRSGAKLPKPLVAEVRVLTENDYVPSTQYHKVKFEVTKGGGTVQSGLASLDENGRAQTYWVLGQDSLQQVKAVAVDGISGKEISEPVYYNATIEKSAMVITAHKHSFTNMRLSVMEPSGNIISRSNPVSESGGRFSTKSNNQNWGYPCIESIKWDSIIPGSYKVYITHSMHRDECTNACNTPQHTCIVGNQIVFDPFWKWAGSRPTPGTRLNTFTLVIDEDGKVTDVKMY